MWNGVPHATILVDDPIADDSLGLMSRVRPFRLKRRKRLSMHSGGVEETRGNTEKEKSDDKRTDGLSHAPPPRESRKRLVSRFKCPGIYWVGQIQQSWPLPRPRASLACYFVT